MLADQKVRMSACVIVLAVLAGCATPSLQPFADATAQLRDIVLDEEVRLLVEAKGLLRHSELTGTQDGSGYVALNKVLGAFEANRPASKSALDAAVRYAQAIARISARSEKGDEAVARIFGAANTVAAALSSGFNLSAVDASVRKPVEAIFTAIGRIDGQQKLLAIMADMQVQTPSKGVVPAFQSAIKVVATDVHLALASAMQANAANIFRSAYGRPERWFTQVRGRACVDFYRAHILDSVQVAPPVGSSTTFTRECVPEAARPTEERALRLHLLEVRTADVTKALAALAESRALVAAHVAAAHVLITTADAWADEHGRVHAYLQRCGGLRLLSRNCGELKVDGLMEAISDLRNKMVGGML